MKTTIKIVERIKELNNSILALKKQGLPLFKIYYKLQNKVDEILRLFGIELKKYTFLTWDMKMFYILGFLPRSGKNILAASCIIYFIIRNLNPNAKIEILKDGSLLGKIQTESKTHIILQSHLDVVYFTNNFDYGPYGSNPQISFYYKNNFKYFGIKKQNQNCVLGADDGKGIVTILRAIKTLKQNQNYPNITFLFTAIEEAPFGKSISDFISNKFNLIKLFPQNLDTKVYFNLDSYSGTEVDLYSNDNLLYEYLKMQNWIISEHEKYLNENNMISSQADAWINPPSEVGWIKSALNEQNEHKEVVFISLACGCVNPHTLQEEINLFELVKFNEWFINLLKLIK